MEIKHYYGKNVHLLDHPVLLSLLVKIGHPDTQPPELNDLLRLAYQIFAQEVICRELPTVKKTIPTRMRGQTRHGYYRGPILDPQTRVVVAAVARAGLIPAETCFELLSTLLNPSSVRLDYLSMSRLSDRSGRVIGVRMNESKIGGTIDRRILIVPDPMGATGSTMVDLLSYYRKNFGRPQKILLLSLIATSEFIGKIQGHFPNAVIYAARLDRGLSSRKVLSSVPGKYRSLEKGLNENQYIVPGAGGMGEALTNSWV